MYSVDNVREKTSIRVNNLHFLKDILQMTENYMYLTSKFSTFHVDLKIGQQMNFNRDLYLGIWNVQIDAV